MRRGAPRLGADENFRKFFGKFVRAPQARKFPEIHVYGQSARSLHASALTSHPSNTVHTPRAQHSAQTVSPHGVCGSERAAVCRGRRCQGAVVSTVDCRGPPWCMYVVGTVCVCMGLQLYRAARVQYSAERDEKWR